MPNDIVSGKCKTEKFIEKAIKLHGELYDYSLVDIKNNYHIIIKCRQHGSFLEVPRIHLIGGMIHCPECIKEIEILRLKEKVEKNKKTRKKKKECEILD